MNHRPVIHFAHANGLPAGTYRYLFKHIEPFADVHAIPMLAHNPKYPVENNWEKLIDELIDYIDALNVEKPIIGVGHSFGALLTFLASKKRPDLFSQIILFDPPTVVGAVSAVYQLGKWFGFMDKISPAGRSKFRKAAWESKDAAYDNLHKKNLCAGWPEETVRDYIDAATAPVSEDSDEIKLTYLVDTECEIFRTIPGFIEYKKPLNTVPTTYVYGEKSEVCLPYVVKRFTKHQRIPSIKMKGGHMFPLQHAEETAALIKSLIETSS